MDGLPGFPAACTLQERSIVVQPWNNVAPMVIPTICIRSTTHTYIASLQKTKRSRLVHSLAPVTRHTYYGSKGYDHWCTSKEPLHSPQQHGHTKSIATVYSHFCHQARAVLIQFQYNLHTGVDAASCRIGDKHCRVDSATKVARTMPGERN